MNKLLFLAVATAATMVFTDAGAANPDPSRSAPVPGQPTPNPGMQPIPDSGVVMDGAQSGAEMTDKDRVYLGALKKCESLAGTQKQACIEAARKKAGEM